MLIQYSPIFKIYNIKNLCKIYGIKNYSKLNKSALLELINLFKAVCYIQKFIRNKWINSEVCPITLESLEYPFVSLKNTNRFRYYSIDGIINYYNSSKDFRDPFTKEPISSTKIQEINKLAKFYKKKTISVAQRGRTIPLQRRTELLTILCCLNDIINNIMSTTIITQDYIYNFAIPQIMTYVYYLLIRCRQQYRNIVQHFIDILERHPDPNKYHIINYLVGIILNEDN